MELDLVIRYIERVLTDSSPLTHCHTSTHTYSTEVPVLWVRVDPDYQWLRQVFMDQSDTVWHCLLKFERDACSQLEALQALEGYPSIGTRDAYREALLNGNFYYRVRIQAAQSLAKVCVCVCVTIIFNQDDAQYM